MQFLKYCRQCFFFNYYFNRTRYHFILITALYEWTLDFLRTADEIKQQGTIKTKRSLPQANKAMHLNHFSLLFRVYDFLKNESYLNCVSVVLFHIVVFSCFNVKSNAKMITHYVYLYYYSQLLLLPIITIIIVILQSQTKLVGKVVELNSSPF